MHAFFRKCIRTAPLALLVALAACDGGLVAPDPALEGAGLAKNPQPKTPVCHYDAEDGAYYRLDVGGGGLAAHLAHGDLPFDDDYGDDDPNDGDGIYCVSKPVAACLDGRIVFASTRDDLAGEIYTMYPDGSDVTRLTYSEATDYDPVWSPDGQKIAFVSRRDGNEEIYTMNADGSDLANVTQHEADDREPNWSPDGSKLVFRSDRDGDSEIFITNADGSGMTQQFTFDDTATYGPDWSPDGSKIIYSRYEGGAHDLFIMPAGGGLAVNLTNTDTWESHPEWSPDGSQIVYVRNQGFDWYISVMNADGTGATDVSDLPNDVTLPSWSPDGSRLIFSAEGDLYITEANGSNPVNVTQSPEWVDGQGSWTASCPSPGS